MLESDYSRGAFGGLVVALRKAFVFFAVVLPLASALSLSACGKKPKLVDPPEGVGKDAFPAVYPDPSTQE